MPTNIDISRPEGSTAQLLFNIVDENGSAIDVTNWTNFELSTYIEPALEFDRTVTFDDTAGGTFSEDIRVIVGDTSVANNAEYIPYLLSTNVKEVTVFKGRGNRFSVSLSHNGAVIDLSVFSRFELYGLTDSPIDSGVTAGVIDWDDGNGIINIDAGETATASNTAKTTLVGYSTSYPEGIVLWHPSLAQAHVTVNLISA